MSTATQQALAFAKNRPNSYLSELFDFLRIPSIGTRPEHDDDVRAAADWLADNMREAGLENVAILPTIGHPMVYADWLHAGNDKPTVLFYGHYDVQPADNVDLWKSPPFEPAIRKENVYARGASDDKGQVLIMVKAVEAYLQSAGSLPVNVKFLIEGEEESGSTGIALYIPENKPRLAADVAFVADTAMADFGHPAIVYGLRGIVSLNVELSGPKLDLHSGGYGGAINNPVNALARLLAKLQDDDGHIQVPGFYDNVRTLSDDERELLASAPFDEASWLEWTKAPAAWGEQQFTAVERMGARPTLDVNGFVGGYGGDGGKTIIPAHAHAKISMRLVPDQDPARILELVDSYVKSLVPKSVRVRTESVGTAPPVVTDLESPAMRAAKKACMTVYDHEPVFKRSGGSIPVVGHFKQHLDLDTILLGFGLPHDRLHAPNERFYLPNYYSGIETVIRFLENYGRDEA